jgi:SAM-dependent methyltransferase
MARLRTLARTIAFRTGLIRYFWQWRHFVDGSYRAVPDVIVSDDPHRLRLAELLAPLEPESCCEIGCSDGANLSMLASRHPACVLSGIDLNRHALRVAAHRVRAVGGSVGVMRRGAASHVPLATGAVDVALSDAVFMYLTPANARLAVREMRRVARRAIFIHTFSDDGLAEGQLVDGNWVHPVGRILAEVLPSARVHRERSPLVVGQWGQFGTIFEVTW